ncbi:MAG: PleD family two-component system response regulator, partial [Pseudomonadota bacterium]
LDICSAGKCDIVLLDVMMPGMDGYEVCRRLKADPKTAHLPVIMVTALDQPSDKLQGLEAGADDFLTKPVDDLALTTRVKSLARLKMLTDELQLRVSTSEEMGLQGSAAALSQLLDGRQGKILIVDDKPASYDRMSRILTSEQSISVVSNPQEALFRAAQEDFDLVIVSLAIEGFDALRLCSQLRSLDRTRMIPLLLVTGEGDDSQLIRAIDLGVNDYLKRPVEPNELLARCRTQVRRKRANDQLRHSVQQTMEMAIKDPLTGLFNRRYFDTHMEALLDKACASSQPLSLMVLDIDHFKMVNDTYGHQAGDEVLKTFAERIQRNMRAKNLVCRFGGEEFVIALPETDRDLAYVIADRMRREIAEAPFVVLGGEQSISVTVSAGIASLQGPQDHAGDLVKRADEALYEAKRNGRNQVVQAAA